MSKPSTSNRKTSASIPKDSFSQNKWSEAIQIIDENGDKFLVSWAGIDPSTGKEWKPTWVHCSMYQADKRSLGKIVHLLFWKPGKESQFNKTYHLKTTGLRPSKFLLKTETNLKYHGLASTHQPENGGNQLG